MGNNTDINLLLHEAKQTYDEATCLKDTARKDKLKFNVYLQAADKFQQSGDIYNKIIDVINNQGEINDKVTKEYQAYREYYYYEKEQCLMVFYYEKRQIDDAKNHYQNCQIHLKNAIHHLESSEINDEKSIRQLAVWYFFQQNDKPFYYSMLARNAWDHEDVIEALDYFKEAYHSSIKVKDLAIQYVDKGILDPVYKRISIANNIGMAANINSAMARNLYEKNGNKMPGNYAVILLGFLWEVYFSGLKAYEENPEWEDYLTGSHVMKESIGKILMNNKNLSTWKSIYIEFKENKGFLKIMENLDTKQFNRTKQAVELNNKSIRLWSIGGFWLFSFLVIFGLITLISRVVEWYYFLAILCFGQTIFTVIGAFILRTIDELSQQNFLKLIGVAFQYQFKFLGSFSKKVEEE